MHDRNALQQSHSVAEMREILDSFAADEEKYSNDLVHRRRGLVKTLIEEYAPLYRMACELPNLKSARLTAQSHPGPDAIVEMEDGSEVTIQITTAGESQSTALQREMLSKGEPVFANQSASRSPSSKAIETKGRVLSTKNANTVRMVDEVKTALQKKIATYRPETQYLLVLIRQPSLTMNSDWQSQLQIAFENTSSAPYKAVYVANTDACYRCAGA